MPDDYGVTAEFHDVLTADHAAMIGSALPPLLAEVDPAAGPVVDLGAGTGLVAETIARTLADARIVAVEPAAAMRAALITRLTCAGVLHRVTVRAAGALDDALPDQIGGLTAFAMLGHLDADSRAKLWWLLADRLAPTAPAIIQALPPHSVTAVPETLFAQARLGDDVIQGSGLAEIVDDHTVRWHMTYRALSADAVLREERATYLWHPLHPDDVIAEAATAGLHGETAGEDLVVLRTAW
jgi:SAM-dependent methyltransferase